MICNAWAIDRDRKAFYVENISRFVLVDIPIFGDNGKVIAKDVMIGHTAKSSPQQR
jgi:hypothetical protein